MLFFCGTLGNIGLYGVLIPVLVSFLVYDVLSLAIFKKMLKARYDLAINFGRTLAASAVAGFAIFLIDMAFSKKIGEILTLIICVPVFYFAYLAIMVIIGGIDTRELKGIPFAKHLSVLPVLFKNDEV